MRSDRLWRHFMQPRAAVGLAMFRIVYSLTLLAEVVQLFSLRHLVFGETVSPLGSDLWAEPVFGLWAVCVLCLVIGLFTRTAAVLNYLMTLATFSTFSLWEYHVDYVYTGINCFLLFVPVGRAVSVDAWLLRRRQADRGRPLPSETVPRIHYDALILVGIAMVYFDSVFYKLASPMWLAGLGVWRPASLPHNTYWNVTRLLDVKPLMLTLGYLTLAFECLFLPLMWFDRLRPWLLIVGMGLHLGIVVMFPIPWFGLAVFALYLLLVPDQWWSRLGDRVSRKTQIALASTVGDGETSEMLQPQRHSDSVTAGVVFALTLIVCTSQLVMTSTAPLTTQITARYGGESVRRAVARLAVRSHPAARKLFGVTPHPVFMDFHFDGYEAFFTLVHVDEQGRHTWLPMASPTGQGRLGWSGRLWVNWTWRVSNPQPDPDMLRSGFRRVTAWWLDRRRQPLDEAKFLVMRRDCDACDGWSEGYYQRQLDHAWEPVGVAHWHHGEFNVRFDHEAVALTRRFE